MCAAGVRRPRASIEKRTPGTRAQVTAVHALCRNFSPGEIHRPKAAWDKAFTYLSTAVETGVER
jgi:hypothetical protein